jgi:hypothetical protein
MAHSLSVHSILSVPFYDTKAQQYTKILCVNAVPVAGPLAARVKTVRPPRLSGLCGSSGSSGNCIHAIASSSSSSYMTPDDLPELFAFLVSNGYTVDLGLTKLAAKHQSGGGVNANANANANANSLVCIISHS